MVRLALFSLFAIGSASARSTFVPKSQTAALSVRGGAGPLDPELVAKVATGVIGAQGAAGVLAPDKMLEMYGSKGGGVNTVLARRFATALLTVGLIGYGQVVKDLSLETTVGITTLPWLAEMATHFLNGEPSKLGIQDSQQYMLAAVFAACAYGTLVNTEYAELAIKVWAVWFGGNGILLAADPSRAMDLWGIKGNATSKALFRALGFAIANIGTTVWMLQGGTDTLQAIGYGWAWSLACSVAFNFITNEADALGLDANGQNFWLVLSAIVAGTLAI